MRIPNLFLILVLLCSLPFIVIYRLFKRKKDLERRVKQAEAERNAAAARMSQLEANVKISAAEIEKARDELKARNIDLQNMIREKENLEGFLDELIKENKELKRFPAKYQELEKKAEKAKRRDMVEVSSQRKQLEALWPIIFPKFVFKPGALREASKLHFNDMCCLVKKLYKLHETREPRRLSLSKLESTGDDHLKVQLSDGFPARLAYKVQGSEIEIIKFYKHNENYMK